MSELTVTVLRLGLLVLLWVFVLGAVGVLRRDLFGTKVVPRTPTPKRKPAAQTPPQATRRQPRPAPQPTPQRDRATPTSVVVTDGSLRGTKIALAQSPVLIGRSPDSTLVLTDDYASTRHARLFPKDGKWFVEDLGSTNGTYLGDQKLTAPTQVQPGTRLRIGRTVLELRR